MRSSLCFSGYSPVPRVSPQFCAILVAFPLLEWQFFYPDVQIRLIRVMQTTHSLLHPMIFHGPWLRSVFASVLLLLIPTYPDCRICVQCLRRTISTRILTYLFMSL